MKQKISMSVERLDALYEDQVKQAEAREFIEANWEAWAQEVAREEALLQNQKPMILSPMDIFRRISDWTADKFSSFADADSNFELFCPPLLGGVRRNVPKADMDPNAWYVSGIRRDGEAGPYFVSVTRGDVGPIDEAHPLPELTLVLGDHVATASADGDKATIIVDDEEKVVWEREDCLARGTIDCVLTSEPGFVASDLLQGEKVEITPKAEILEDGSLLIVIRRRPDRD